MYQNKRADKYTKGQLKLDIQNNINIKRPDLNKNTPVNKAQAENTPVQTENNPEKVMAGLNSLASINRVAITAPKKEKEEFAINL